MVFNTSMPGSSSRQSSPGRIHCQQDMILMPLCIHYYYTWASPFLTECWGVTCDRLAPYLGGVTTLLAVLCYRNRRYFYRQSMRKTKSVFLSFETKISTGLRDGKITKEMNDSNNICFVACTLSKLFDISIRFSVVPDGHEIILSHCNQ